MDKNGMEPLEKEATEEGITTASYTRITATAVLVVAIPMLLLSSSALAVFYIAPDRFDSILTRLPGEAAIRTILIFAPVTLLAIIVLALLYAFEKPSVEVTRPLVIPAREPRGEPVALSLQRVGWWTHLGAFGALLVLIPIRAAAFLSPTRFENYLSRFPGDQLLNFLVHTGPFIFLGIEVVAVILFISSRLRPLGREVEVKLPGMMWLRKVGSTRLAVGIVLVFSLPILLLSLTSLILFFARTERFLDMIRALPGEVPLRMGLIFIPASLIIVVTLALMFLTRRWTDPAPPIESILGGHLSWDLSLWYLSWIFVWGIALASAMIMGLVAGTLVLILR